MASLRRFSLSVQQTLTWCVVPSTVHVLQNDTCVSLGSVASNEFVVHAMQGEEENQQTHMVGELIRILQTK